MLTGAATGDEEAVAARHGAGHLAAALVAARAVVDQGPWPDRAERTAAIVGLGIGAAVHLLREAPMPAAYAAAQLERSAPNTGCPAAATARRPSPGTGSRWPPKGLSPVAGSLVASAPSGPSLVALLLVAAVPPRAPEGGRRS